jgi:hypothetical protein
MPGGIVFNSIVANGMETNAAIFIGQNGATGWDSNNKNQMGVGMVFGAYNAFPTNLIAVYDSDIFDTAVNDSDLGSSVSKQI